MELDLDRLKWDDTGWALLDVGGMGDDELFKNIEGAGRIVGFQLDQYRAFVNELERRELLVKTEVPLPERTDNWLTERRAEIKKNISELKRQDDELKAERDDIDMEFMSRFGDRGTTGTRAAGYTVSLREDDRYPEIEDRNVFEEYIFKTRNIHLLQKRLSMKAIREELNIMEQEKLAIEEELEERQWSDDACIEALRTIYEEENEDVDQEQIDRKITVLGATGKLREAAAEGLKALYSIPGISLVTKLTINQVKRGK